MTSLNKVSDIPNIAPLAGQKEGYRLFNMPHTHSAVVFLSRANALTALINESPMPEDLLVDRFEAPEFGRAAVDWVESQGLVRKSYMDNVRGTLEGVRQFERAEEMEAMIGHYTDIKNSVKLEHQMANSGETVDLQKTLDGKEKTKTGVEALVAPAVSYLAHARLKDSEYLVAGMQLLDGVPLKLDQLEVQHEENVALYISVLQAIHALEYDAAENSFMLTSRGRSLFRRVGGGELTLSYYKMLQKRYDLAIGEEVYGKDGSVYRDAELNAHASNAITAVRAAPVAIDKMRDLGKFTSEETVLIDNGSGGAELLMRAVDEDAVNLGIGIDFNERTNTEAQRLIENRGLGDRIQLITGSIWDKDVVRHVSEIIGDRKAIATIFALQHDIGPEAAAKQLQAHAELLPDVPLIVTETPKVPMDVLRHNPHARAANFQDMHTSSGQHLYTMAELIDLHHSNGFEISSTDTLASLSSEKGVEYPTAVNMVVRPKR